MTPLFRLANRYLPTPLAVVVVGLCYGIVLAVTLYGMGRIPGPFAYL